MKCETIIKCNIGLVKTSPLSPLWWNLCSEWRGWHQQLWCRCWRLSLAGQPCCTPPAKCWRAPTRPPRGRRRRGWNVNAYTWWCMMHHKLWPTYQRWSTISKLKFTKSHMTTNHINCFWFWLSSITSPTGLWSTARLGRRRQILPLSLCYTIQNFF